MGRSPANAAQSGASTGEKSSPLPAMAKQSFIRKKGAGRGGPRETGLWLVLPPVFSMCHTPL